MIRKVLAFMLSAIICSSLYAAEVPPGTAYAVEGTFSGIVSALLSASSDPKVSLQGVTVTEGTGTVPDSISFVRSDASTYRSSLRFFSSAGRSEYLDSLLASLSSFLNAGDDDMMLAEGDVILDGVVRFSGSGPVTAYVSMLVTGNAVTSSIVIEGVFNASPDGVGGVIIRTERAWINGTEYTVPDLTFPLPSLEVV